MLASSSSSSSSSSSNDSLCHPHPPSLNSSAPSDKACLFSKPSSYIFTTFNITTILLLLPLCIFILYHGLQRWKKMGSSSSAAPMSHCDCFTYHMVTLELVGVLASILGCWAVSRKDSAVLRIGLTLFSFTWFGQMSFHLLTCVERYLAVVHPITYLSLRQERGVRIRNITTGCVWLSCFGKVGLKMTGRSVVFTVEACLLFTSLAVASFCSLSVLCVLIRPGPGEQGGSRKRVDQSKRRAFYTIEAILGALVLRFAGKLVWILLHLSVGGHLCLMLGFEFWCNLPSSLVLPLLFLHREGKLICSQ